ncbi:hypothetical protein [Belnapia sp. F-4-1]|uniref:hypothetical protein n=1 Tax=Belnapia sp. F-4-1 TaxID=1545443 RepID=UPI0005BAE6B6|nr:hypothetical protein [Belnapia sp. F-4-1]
MNARDFSRIRSRARQFMVIQGNASGEILVSLIKNVTSPADAIRDAEAFGRDTHALFVVEGDASTVVHVARDVR